MHQTKPFTKRHAEKKFWILTYVPAIQGKMCKWWYSGFAYRILKICEINLSHCRLWVRKVFRVIDRKKCRNSVFKTCKKATLLNSI